MSNLGKCYICNSNNIIFCKKVDKYLIVKCNDCKLKWVFNLEEVASIYEVNYFVNESKIGYRDYLNDEVNHRINARNILKIVSRFRNLSKLKVLEIGSAFGFLLDEVRKLTDCEVSGVDSSGYACEYARTQLKLSVLNTEIVPGLFPPKSFDVIFMIGTIEHLTSPNKVLAIVKDILRPGGLLVITTMDTSGRIPLVALKPPEHLFYFNHDNLSNLLKQFNFKVLDIRTHFVSYFLYDIVYRLGNIFSSRILISFSKILGEIFPKFYLKIPTPEIIVIAKV